MEADICGNRCQNVSELRPPHAHDANATLAENEPFLNYSAPEFGEWDETFFNATFESGGSEGQYNLWALSLVVFPLLTLVGNVLVILSVARERSLQTATNYFIVSLAVADLLVAVVVMPFGVYYLVNGAWGLPPLVCDCYIAMDVTCSTSSIFNLVAISVDRYIAVTQPIKYAKHRSGARVWAMIAAAWLVSAAIGCPLVLGLNRTAASSADQCLFNNTDYVIYSSLGSFYVPCLIMMLLYSRIFKAIRQRARKQRGARRTCSAGGAAAVVIENAAHRFAVSDDRATRTASGSRDDDDDDDDKCSAERSEVGELEAELAQSRSARLVLAAVVEETGLIMANLASPIPMMDPTTNNDSGYVPSNMEAEKEHSPPPSPRDGEVPSRPEPKTRLGRPGDGSLISTPRRRFRSAASAARFTIFRANRAGKLRAKSFAKKEKKATQTLAVVLGVFLVCWAPFFSCSVLDALCTKFGLDYSPGVTAFILTTWLGYINSFLNPVIYTIFNPEFRKAFRKILYCS